MRKTGLAKLLILGRPNVGKSTLFNRLIGRRMAITDPIPGATRDALEQVIFLQDRQVLLIDSAGCRPDTSSVLEEMASQYTMGLIAEADLILLVVEGHALVSEDYLIIDQLRKSAKKVLLVANKCDSPEKEQVLPELYRLGLGEPLSISAEHNRRMHELKEALYHRLPALLQPKEEHKHQRALKIAIVGKPNAGKSSLANALTGQARSLVSEIAGTTRDTVSSQFVYKDQWIEILDTAGLRRTNKVKERLEYYATTRTDQAISDCDLAYLLIDIQEGLTEQDKKIADKIVELHKPFLFVLNKCDLHKNHAKKIKGKSIAYDNYDDEVGEIRRYFPVLAYVPVVVISSQHTETLPKLLQATLKVYRETGRQVDEHELVRALKEWVIARPPARRGNRPPLLRSLRQVGQYPPRFALKVYGEVDDNYVRYITNNVRKEFGFPSVPLVVEVVHGS